MPGCRHGLMARRDSIPQLSAALMEVISGNQWEQCLQLGNSCLDLIMSFIIHALGANFGE